MVKVRLIGSFAAVLCSALFAASALAAPLNVRVRDSYTGRSVDAVVSVADTGSRAICSRGFGSIDAPAGDHPTLTAAKGYRDVEAKLNFGSVTGTVTIWIDPIQPDDAVVKQQISPGSTLIYGHVFDANGNAVAGAGVRLSNLGAEAQTDENGYFAISLATPPVDPAGDLPQTADLIVESGGVEAYRRTNILLAEGANHYIVDLGARGEAKQVDGTHKLYLPKDELARTQTLEGETLPVAMGSPIDQPSSVTVPATIRVGSSCGTKTTCSIVNVYTLDTYVRLGLDDEWISSWNTNSLKAGAIAYRTYGVYHIFHPLTANYDICNTTSCQVIDPNDSASSVDTATQQTTGSIVTDASGSAPFFAEYAAENNGSACPDGFTGNNSSWPCMSDPVDAGQTFNGHGRGMCQWGTQRWSVNQGKDFVWIVNHYYNNNGSPSGLRTGVLQLSPNSVLPPPDMAAPGNTTAPGLQVSTLTPAFDWQSVDGADGYGLYISKFNGSTYDLIYNSETAVGQPLTGTSFTLPDGLLVNGAQYRWNMSSHNAAGYGSANTFRDYFFVSLPATVSGRVVTPSGTGLRNATVTISDGQGSIRRTLTSSLGYFSFDAVTTNRSYTVTASSKRYRFAPQTISPAGDLTMPDLTGQE